MLKPEDFFDLTDWEHQALFADLNYVWEGLAWLKSYLENLWARMDQTDLIQGEISSQATLHGDQIYIGKGTVVEEGVSISGPTYIGENCEIRQGAYLRGNVLVGNGCVIGHSSEIKHSIMLNESKAPHFAYLGDSILGQRVNLGAGTKLSNLTVVSEKDKKTGQRPTIKIRINDKVFDTGLAKLGAILGDDAQTGCNSVTNPGCLIGPRTLVYANTSVPKGYLPPDSMVKLRQQIVIEPRDPHR